MNPPIRRKITNVESLTGLLRPARDAGTTIVHCHGCFDIVHPGHIRYLQSARQLGDVLVVSLTGDAVTQKGTGQPYIPQDLRAENLAALEFVDWVIIDPHPTACELLSALRPDVYVKGREYADSHDPRFLREREVVESYGGRVVFHSGDVVFSSTGLIARLGPDAQLDHHRLRALFQRHALRAAEVSGTLRAWEGLPVAVVGDLVRERYVFCDASTLADDAPVLSLQRLTTADYWGGAAGAALQVAALGARPTLFAALGEDEAGTSLTHELTGRGVEVRTLPGRRRFVERSTFVADDAKLFELTEGSAAPLDGTLEQQAAKVLREQIAECQLLLWCDHGCGTLTSGLIQAGTRTARAHRLTIAGHAPGPRGQLANLEHTDLLAANERRLREAAGDMTSSLPAVAWKLLNRTHGRTLLVSLPKRGLIGFDGRGENSSAAPPASLEGSAGEPPLGRLRSEFIPALADAYIDTLGVEATVLIAAALTLAVGRPLALAAYLAAAGEALAVSRAGNEPVQAAELLHWLSCRPELGLESRFHSDGGPAGEISPAAAAGAASHA